MLKTHRLRTFEHRCCKDTECYVLNGLSLYVIFVTLASLSHGILFLFIYWIQQDTRKLKLRMVQQPHNST